MKHLRPLIPDALDNRLRLGAHAGKMSVATYVRLTLAKWAAETAVPLDTLRTSTAEVFPKGEPKPEAKRWPVTDKTRAAIRHAAADLDVEYTVLVVRVLDLMVPPLKDLIALISKEKVHG